MRLSGSRRERGSRVEQATCERTGHAVQTRMARGIDMQHDRDRGRLRRTGDGSAQVVTGLDAAALDEVYRGVFG